MGRKKGAKETFIEYATELRALGNGVPIDESWYVTAFTNGVDGLTRGLVRVQAPTTLMEAAHVAARLRGNDGSYVARAWGSHNKENDRGAGKYEKKPRFGDKRAPPSRMLPVKTHSRGRPGPYQRPDKSFKSEGRACFVCGEDGHFARACPQRRDRRDDEGQGNDQGA